MAVINGDAGDNYLVGTPYNDTINLDTSATENSEIHTVNEITSTVDEISVDWSRFGAPHISSFEEFITWKETQRLEFIQESIETGLQEEARLTNLIAERQNGLSVGTEASVDPLTGVDTETLESLLSETQTRTEYSKSLLEEPDQYIWQVNYFLPTGNYIGDSEIIAVPPGSSDLAKSIFGASQPEGSFTIVEVKGLAYPEDLFASPEYSAESFLG